ncbi:hypothetical protein GGU10DRAFT_361329 [Lentinula aff. detonsa]|uniref:Uncharacterized protein n=1 Tax=Lentinula aff. detonsa TaxID=2804958 RepID=A0AA38KV32_9AGAR|nr:hypothetical protein GGU10DRAFT_361329 [Lentinula aff. detonsa]
MDPLLFFYLCFPALVFGIMHSSSMYLSSPSYLSRSILFLCSSASHLPLPHHLHSHRYCYPLSMCFREEPFSSYS